MAITKTTFIFSVAALLLGLSFQVAAQKNPALAEDAKAINSACQADGATAGCGQEVVGKGLLKCIGAYRKAHKDFKVSDGCHAAIKKLDEDRKAPK
jgi:hypothetical protein